MSIVSLLTNYILVIIYDSFVSLVLAVAIIFIFRIRDSNIKILFFFLPLLKPFLILLEDFNLNSEFFNSRQGTLGIRFPSPNTIFSRIDNIERSPFHSTNINKTIIITLLLIFLIILIIRWIHLYLFYKKLAYEERVNPKDLPDIHIIVKKFSKRIDIKPPDISLTHKKYFNPFVIGIKSHLVVLSPILLDNLLLKEKDILIKHELSHIKRKDNLIGWFALILRDLLFFNPFAHITYNLIKLEQEIGSDKVILKYSNYSSKEIAKNILNLILKIIKGNHINNKSSVTCQNMFYNIPFKKANILILNYRIKSILNTSITKINAKKITRSLFYILFFFLLLMQIVLIIKINNNFLLLR